MELDSLKKLLIEELRDLYSAEKQLTKALPKMAKAASNQELSDGFTEHLEETEGHVERLEQIFEELEVKASGKTCKAMKGLIEEGGEMMKEEGADAVIDAGLIACAQRVEHYEIAAYGCARTYAETLGLDKIAKILQTTLDEEAATDEKLTQIATSVVNLEAAEGSDEEEVPDSVRRKGKSTSRLNARASR